MHISEGILTGPSFWATTVAGAVVMAWGVRDMKRFVKEQPERKPLLGMAGAFIFLVSLIPIPAYMGTCSHPCGTPLAGILLGPGIGAALSGFALFLQALLFAHGGFSTMGANVLSLGGGGSVGGWLFFKLGRKLGLPLFTAAALGGLMGDVVTYLISGGILGGHLAFVAPQPQYSFAGYLAVIMAAYLPVQGPIALGEMVITGIAVRSISRQRPEVLEALGVVSRATVVLLLVLSMAAGFMGLASEARAADLIAVRAEGRPKTEKPKTYTGMDEKVNEAMAEKAGAKAHTPYINLEDKGDVWNTILLAGGALAGFIIGRCWHLLFVRQKDTVGTSNHSVV
ncbi:MAG: energy-coupling factor ABC transporter permease [Geobacteraceae bacterium]|nr:energy-coupling factor ABC transporter permease [Geobacteraceae bacterium]